MRSVVRVVGLVCCLALSANRAWAAWPTDLSANVAVDASWAWNQQVATDGGGAVFVAWEDGQNGSKILVQRFDSSGSPTWPGTGVDVAPSAAVGQTNTQIVSDGEGGAFVTWARTSGLAINVFAQHLNSSGALLWGPYGKPVTAGTVREEGSALIPDGSGGLIVAWDQGSVNNGVFAQRLDATGTMTWGGSGVLLGKSFGAMPRVVPDGAGGAIVLWFGARHFSPPLKAYVQRVSSAGARMWGDSALAVSSGPGSEVYPSIVTDGSGGAIIAWQGAGNAGIYGQRVNSSGSLMWPASGIGICTAPGGQAQMSMAADDAGGALLCWADARGDSSQVYAQRINGSGTAQWSANGVGLFTGNRAQIQPSLSPDGAGGAFVAWMDHRSGEFQMYGQRLSGNGLSLWVPGGLALSTSPARQERPRVTWDGTSGAVVAWTDFRGPSTGIYAQGVSAAGIGGPPNAGTEGKGVQSTQLRLASANPYSSGGLQVAFTLRGGEPAVIDVFDTAGRVVVSRSVGYLGRGSHAEDLLRGVGRVPGVYLVRLKEGSTVCMVRAVRL